MIAFGFSRPSIFPFGSSIYCIVWFCRVCAKCWWQNRLNACDKRFFSFLFFVRSLSYPDTKRPRNWVPGGAYKFLCWAIIKFARACLLLHLLCACTACFNVVDNGQLNLGERIRGVRPMNPKRFDHYAGNATVNEYRIFWIIKLYLFFFNHKNGNIISLFIWKMELTEKLLNFVAIKTLFNLYTISDCHCKYQYTMIRDILM